MNGRRGHAADLFFGGVVLPALLFGAMCFSGVVMSALAAFALDLAFAFTFDFALDIFFDFAVGSDVSCSDNCR